MNTTDHRDLSRRERQILDIIYQRGQATAAEVQAELPEPPSYSAVRRVAAGIPEVVTSRTGAPTPPAVGAAIIGIAEETPNFSSKTFTNSERSRTLIFSISETRLLNFSGTVTSFFSSDIHLLLFYISTVDQIFQQEFRILKLEFCKNPLNSKFHIPNSVNFYLLFA